MAWTFYTHVMGGVERLSNGNTLIVESVNGRIFEVTPDCELVWDYINPDFEDLLERHITNQLRPTLL